MIASLEFDMNRNKLRRLIFIIAIGFLFLRPGFVTAEAVDGPFDLRLTIEAALKANLELQRSKDEIDAATANKNAATSQFFPTLNEIGRAHV